MSGLGPLTAMAMVAAYHGGELRSVDAFVFSGREGWLRLPRLLVTLLAAPAVALIRSRVRFPLACKGKRFPRSRPRFALHGAQRK
jgi:hypothetical protein